MSGSEIRWQVLHEVTDSDDDTVALVIHRDRVALHSVRASVNPPTRVTVFVSRADLQALLDAYPAGRKRRS